MGRIMRWVDQKMSLSWFLLKNRNYMDWWPAFVWIFSETAYILNKLLTPKVIICVVLVNFLDFPYRNVPVPYVGPNFNVLRCFVLPVPVLSKWIFKNSVFFPTLPLKNEKSFSRPTRHPDVCLYTSLHQLHRGHTSGHNLRNTSIADSRFMSPSPLNWFFLLKLSSKALNASFQGILA